MNEAIDSSSRESRPAVRVLRRESGSVQHEPGRTILTSSCTGLAKGRSGNSAPPAVTFLALAALALTACSAVQTITPTRVHSQTSSYDASTPAQYPDRTNSGILALVKDSHGQATHAIVTLNVLERYRALIADYGDQLTPQLVPGEDLPPGCAPFTDRWGNKLYTIDTQNLDRLRQLSLWRKSGREKTGALTKLLNKVL